MFDLQIIYQKSKNTVVCTVSDCPPWDVIMTSNFPGVHVAEPVSARLSDVVGSSIFLDSALFKTSKETI